MTFDGGSPGCAGWDGHIALLHASAEAQRAGLDFWVRRGFERSDKVVYADVGGQRQRRMLDSLGQHGVVGAGARAAGRQRCVEVVPLRRLYAPADRRELVERALADGFRGVRVALDTSAALTEAPWQTHARFEQALDVLSRTGPVSGLCMYEMSPAPSWPFGEVVGIHAEGIRERQLATCGGEGGLLIEGEVDMSNEDVLAGALRAASTRSAPTVRLDLSRLSFLSAGGFRAIVSGTAEFRDAGGVVLLVAPLPAVERVVRLLDWGGIRRLELVTGTPG